MKTWANPRQTFDQVWFSVAASVAPRSVESDPRTVPENNRISERIQNYDPEMDILVTHGGIHAYYLALQSILNPGDEVLIPDPSWPTHTNMVKLLRGKVVPVPAPAENGFIPLIESWKEALTSWGSGRQRGYRVGGVLAAILGLVACSEAVDRAGPDMLLVMVLLFGLAAVLMFQGRRVP